MEIACLGVPGKTDYPPQDSRALRYLLGTTAQLVQPLQEWNGGWQQGLDFEASLPCKCLSLKALRFTLPIPADVEMEPHVRMGVDVFNAAPRFRREDLHTEFFEKFALERLENRLAPLDLATREFPIPRIGLALGALTKQNIAVRLHENADGNVDG